MTRDDLHILLVEDNSTDEILIKREISKIAPNAEVSVVKTLEDFTQVISDTTPHLIMSDYSLPTCNGIELLDVAQIFVPSVPFIFVTGTIKDEELAENTILAGASGYILKNNIHNMHIKLEPYIQDIIDNTTPVNPVLKRIMASKTMVLQVKDFMENFKKENLSQREGIKRIREELARLKEEYDFKDTKGKDDSAT